MIFYASRYGYSRQYALWLQEKTGIPAVEMTSASICVDQNPIFIMGAYAGGLNGAKTAKKILEQSSGQAVFIICGLGDPQEEGTIQAGYEMLKRSRLGDSRSTMFFVRGGIDYSRLSAVHKAMMWGLHQKVKNDPRFIDNGFLETYGKQVSFTDPGYLKPVLAYLQQQES